MAAKLPPDRLHTRCVSGKRGHFTKSLAKRSAKHQASRTGLALHVYRCPLCSLYHLTKSPRRVRSRAEIESLERRNGIAS